MSVESDVLKDLDECSGSKSRLLQKYSDRQKEIMNLHGGSIGDIPANSDHEYWDIQRKVQALNDLKGLDK